MGRTDILCGTSGIFTSTGLVLLNLAKGRRHSMLVQTSGISDPGRAYGAVWVKVRQAGLCRHCHQCPLRSNSNEPSTIRFVREIASAAMKNNTKYLIVSLTALCLGGLYVGRDVVSETVCEGPRDGTWAANASRCITKTCYIAGDCGFRAFPAGNCDKILMGDHFGTLHYYLGMPLEIDGNVHRWHADKVDPGIGITARFQSDLLVEFQCKAG